MSASKKKAGHYKESKRKKDNREVLSFEELPLDEYEKQEKKKVNVKLDKKRVFLALAILVILVLSVIVFFNRDALFGCGGRDKTAYNFSATVSGTSVDSGNFREFAEGLCYASDTNFVYLNSKGEEKFSYQHGFAKPVLKSKGDYAIVYDLGANRFSIYNKDGLIFTTATEEKIYLADIDAEGKYILVTKAKGYNGKLYAFSNANKIRYAYSFADYHITSAAMSGDGNSAVVCGVSASKGSKISALYVLNFAQESPVAMHIVENDMLYDCDYLSGESVCAVGQEGAYVCNGNYFGLIIKLPYNGMSVTAYDINADAGVFAFSLSRSGDGRNCDIKYVNAAGNVENVIGTSCGITSLGVYKNRVAFSDRSNVYLFESNGKAVASYSISSVKQIRLFTVSGVYVLGLNGIYGVAL